MRLGGICPFIPIWKKKFSAIDISFHFFPKFPSANNKYYEKLINIYSKVDPFLASELIYEIFLCFIWFPKRLSKYVFNLKESLLFFMVNIPQKLLNILLKIVSNNIFSFWIITFQISKGIWSCLLPNFNCL